MPTQAVLCQLDLSFVPFRQHPADDGSVLKICLSPPKKATPAHTLVASLGGDGGLSQFIHWMGNVDNPDSAVAHRRVHLASLSVTCPKDGKPVVNLIAMDAIPAFRSEIGVMVDVTVTAGPVVQDMVVEAEKSADEQASPAEVEGMDSNARDAGAIPDTAEIEEDEDIEDAVVERPLKRLKVAVPAPLSKADALLHLQELPSGTSLEESEDGYVVKWQDGHVIIGKSEPGTKEKLSVASGTILMICPGTLIADDQLDNGQSHTGIVFNPIAKTKVFCFQEGSEQPQQCTVASLLDRGMTAIQGKGPLVASGKIPKKRPVMHFVPGPDADNKIFMVVYWAVTTGVLNNDCIKSGFVTWMSYIYYISYISYMIW